MALSFSFLSYSHYSSTPLDSPSYTKSTQHSHNLYHHFILFITFFWLTSCPNWNYAHDSHQIPRIKMVYAAVWHVSFWSFLWECCELLSCGQFTVYNKESALKMGWLLSKLFDWVATVLKNTFVTIDVGDFGNTGNSVHVSGVIRTCNLTICILNFTQISTVDSSISDFKFVTLACLI